MKVSMLTPQVPVLSRAELARKKNKTEEDFINLLKDALERVDNLQKNADRLTQQYLAGEIDNIHQVVLATERANLALQLTVQIRNKIIEAYQEISRMQI